MEWRSRIVGHGTEAPDQLLANPRNWRIHPKDQQDALSVALDQVGWVKNVVVNQTTGCVVDGHLRVGLAISREEPEVPVAYVELSEDEERAVIATLDPLAALAEGNEEAYNDLVTGIDAAEDSGPTNPESGAQNGSELLRMLAEQLDPDAATTRANGAQPSKGPIEAICPGCGHEWPLSEEELDLG